MKFIYSLVFLSFIFPVLGFSEGNCKQSFELKEVGPEPIILVKEEARPDPIILLVPRPGPILLPEPTEKLQAMPRPGPILLVKEEARPDPIILLVPRPGPILLPEPLQASN